MVKRHLLRLNAPKSWPVSRKEHTFILRPLPGAHQLKRCMPLGLILRELLKQAKTAREIKKILNDKKILVNKVPITEQKFGVGVFDIIEIPELKEYYILSLNKKGQFVLNKIKKENSGQIMLRVEGKTIVKKNKVQINLSAGKNLLLDKNNYKVGDSLVIDLEDDKVKKHLKLEKGASIFLVDGKYIGTIGTVENVEDYKDLRASKVMFKTKDGDFQTLKEYSYVIDEELLR